MFVKIKNLTEQDLYISDIGLFPVGEYERELSEEDAERLKYCAYLEVSDVKKIVNKEKE